MDTAVADVARSRHDIVVSFLLLAVGHPHARIRPNTSVRAFPGGESWRTHAMNSGMNLGCAMRPDMHRQQTVHKSDFRSTTYACARNDHTVGPTYVVGQVRVHDEDEFAARVRHAVDVGRPYATQIPRTPDERERPVVQSDRASNTYLGRAFQAAGAEPVQDPPRNNDAFHETI